MLRLAPSFPPLWRTESSLQLGTEGAVHIEQIEPWQEKLLDALHDGVADAMLLPLARSIGASSDDAERFLTKIGAALVADAGAPIRVSAELPSEITHTESEALARGSTLR